MHPAVAALVARMEELAGRAGGPAGPGPVLPRHLPAHHAGRRRGAGRGVFEDPDWVARWDVDFAALYLDALEAHRSGPTSVARPWQRAFGADAGLPPEAHVLLGMNAHINYDLPQSLIRMIPPADFADAVPARPSAAATTSASTTSWPSGWPPRTSPWRGPAAGGRRLDRLLAPLNRRASRLFLRESRRKVWANTEALHRARLRGPADYAVCLADLEAASADRVADLLRPGPVLLRLAVHGFGVTLPAT